MLRRHGGLVAVCVVYALLAVGYSLVTPPFESPDEIHHYAFIRELVTERALPVQHEGDIPAQRHQPPLYYLAGALLTAWSDEPDGSPYSVARNNPYWGYAYAEIGRDNKNLYLHGEWDRFPYHGTALAIHVVRLFSILLGLIAVGVTYLTGLELFCGARSPALGGAALLAFNPMFLFISGAINNDNLITLWAVLIVWLLVRTVKLGITRQRSVWVGVLCGLALLTKLTGLYILPVVAVAYLVAAWRHKQWMLFLQGGAIVAGLTLLISGAWFLRNLRLYGDLTSINLTLRTWHARPEGLDWATALFELPNAETSFWARFGYGNVPVPNAWYHFYGIVSRLGAIGCVALAYRQAVRRLPDRADGGAGRCVALLVLAAAAAAGVLYSTVTLTALTESARYAVIAALAVAAGSMFLRDTLQSASRRAQNLAEWPALSGLGVLTLTVAAYFAAMFTYMLMSTTAANGRYMFPALAAVSILVFCGLAYWLPVRWRSLFAVAWTAALAAIAGVMLFAYLQPAYLPPPVLPAEAAETVPQNVLIDYAHQIRLLGASIAPQRARPGDSVDVTLYWQALQPVAADYAVTVQAFGRDGMRIGQRDSFTGLGNYPTSEWSPGEVIVDTYRVPLEPDAVTPVEAVVDVGLYLPDSVDRLPATDSSDRTVGRTSVGSFKLAPRKALQYTWEHDAVYGLGDALVLRGFDLDEDALHPGQTTALTLYWQALADVDADYTVFIHMLDETGQVRVQQDAPPVEGQYPSSLWESGETVQDIHAMKLPADLQPGRYRIALGLYALETMQRLLAVDAQGTRLPDDRIILSEIEVTLVSPSMSE